jgi:DNA-binding transcriptional MocR family regulator
METIPRRGAAAPLLYDRVAGEIAELIARGTYRPGDRIPSIRELSRQRRVSINTVAEAYAQLENRRLLEARPQSGYYVACHVPEPEPAPEHRPARRELTATKVEPGKEPLEVMRTLADPALVPLGRGAPNPELLPADKLNRMLATQVRRFPAESVSYGGAKGLRRLRTQIAKRSLDAGFRLAPDELVVTSGCVEAVTLALQATCRPGDTVAIGSPVYYTFLNSIQWLGLKVLEIPSTPREGMSVDVLAYALRHNAVRACLVISNFNNPLGGVMPDERKEELVKLLRAHDIPLIEDDVYGDLAFAPHRPISAKAFDTTGSVLYCASFSKTLAPGYRVGWIAPGRYAQAVHRLKTLFNIATASPTQLAVAEFLTSGGYDRHVRAMRRTYAAQVGHVRAAIARGFPPGTRVTRPQGGFVVWVELPAEVDGFAVYEQALRKGVSVAPGTLFTTGEKYRSCIRLSAAAWSPRIADALRTVGGIACGLARLDPADVHGTAASPSARRNASKSS